MSTYMYVSRQCSQYVVRVIKERIYLIYLFIRVVLITMERTFLFSILSKRNIYFKTEKQACDKQRYKGSTQLI